METHALKPKPEKYVVLLYRPLNAPMSTSEPTPALATLREHSVGRLQGLNSHPGSESINAFSAVLRKGVSLDYVGLIKT